MARGSQAGFRCSVVFPVLSGIGGLLIGSTLCPQFSGVPSSWLWDDGVVKHQEASVVDAGKMMLGNAEQGRTGGAQRAAGIGDRIGAGGGAGGATGGQERNPAQPPGSTGSSVGPTGAQGTQPAHPSKGAPDVVNTKSAPPASQPSEVKPPVASNDAAGATKRLRVAYAVFITDITSAAWEDGLAILAFGIRRAAKMSRHELRAIVLAPERMDKDLANRLLGIGFDEVVKKPIPVPANEVQKPMAREHMERIQGQNGPYKFAMAEETLKYWGLALTEYDRVLVIDADMMVLDPMDELMEQPEDFIGVYDHGLDTLGSTAPPAQGGFLLLRPNKADFDAVKALTREGDWGGSGWKRSGIGYCYGGVGPDGLLAYYFMRKTLPEMKAITKTKLPEGLRQQRIRGSQWLAADRDVYDIVVNKRLRTELATRDHGEALSVVKSVHFTGDCLKPWACFEGREWYCRGLIQKWWDLRAELEAARGLPPTPRKCVNGKYTPLGRPK